MDDQLSEQQKQYLDDQLKRASAFEEMVRSKGWEYVKAHFQNKVQAFAGSLLLQSDKKIEEFEPIRQELAGLHKLIAFIDNDLNALADFRKKKEGEKDAVSE